MQKYAEADQTNQELAIDPTAALNSGSSHRVSE